MTPLEWSRLRRLLDRACPDGLDPILWRRCREAVLAESPRVPAPVAEPRDDYPLRHLDAVYIPPF